MKNKRGTVLIMGGIILVASALLLTGYNFWDENRALKEADALVRQLQAEAGLATATQNGDNSGNTDRTQDSETADQDSSGLPAYVLNPEMEMPIETIDNRDYIGVLEIPSLGLILPVMNDWSYPDLKIAPCRYEGSVYRDSMILAGHNYKSHFGPISRLKGGEQVIFTDVEGNTFYYEVILKEVLPATAVEEMQEEEWDLTLFTCTLGGQNRTTIRCERK